MSNIKVFGGSSHPELTRAICERLNLPVGRANCTKFANGETKVEIQESVRGEDVFIIQVKSDLSLLTSSVRRSYLFVRLKSDRLSDIRIDKYFRLDADQI